MRRRQIITSLAVCLLVLPAMAGAQSVSYSVSMPKPTSSLLHVVMEIRGAKGAGADIAMPAWAPGAYTLHWAAKHVQELTAEDGDGQPLEARMVGTGTWRIRPAAPVIRVRYKVYVGPSAMNDTHALIDGTRTLMYLVGQAPYPQAGALTVTVQAPAGWKIATGLDQTAPGTFSAPDYDTLVDAPIEVSPEIEIVPFDLDGVRYEIVIHARHNYDTAVLAGDTRNVVAEQVRMMGGAPYKRYVFLFHGTSGTGSGGLEHLNSTSISFGRYTARDRQFYDTFLFGHLARVLPPVERQAHPAGDPRPVRLHAASAHAQPLRLRGHDELLRVALPRALGCVEPAGVL